MKVIQLKNLDKNAIGIAGGKGASLGELTKIGMPVLDGFIVSTKAYEDFLKENRLKKSIKEKLAKLDLKDPKALNSVSNEIKRLILEGTVDPNLKEKILKSFDRLESKYVAVRSSATAEDTTRTSWAGQLSTYLNTTREDLIENVKRCWASLFNPRALTYRGTQKLEKEVSVAVVIQRMVQSKVSGICFTVHPVTKDPNELLIEAGLGLGEAVVSGMITPDTIIVDKSKLKITRYKIGRQNKMITLLDTVKVPKGKQKQRKLSEEEVIKLAKLCIKIEDHCGSPQDIEWALKDRFYILQSRPITTIQ